MKRSCERAYVGTDVVCPRLWKTKISDIRPSSHRVAASEPFMAPLMKCRTHVLWVTHVVLKHGRSDRDNKKDWLWSVRSRWGIPTIIVLKRREASLRQVTQTFIFLQINYKETRFALADKHTSVAPLLVCLHSWCSGNIPFRITVAWN